MHVPGLAESSAQRAPVRPSQSGLWSAAAEHRVKARDPDPDRSVQAALEIGASDEGWLHQTDTYFRVPHGRLKLREEAAVAQLISYERSDETVARESRYRLVPVSDPAGLKDALSDALGVFVVVEKYRRLLLWRGVRIHLDEVRGLGSFIEIEAVADRASDLSTERHRVSELQDALAITPDRIVAFSYSDALVVARSFGLGASPRESSRARSSTFDEVAGLGKVHRAGGRRRRRPS